MSPSSFTDSPGSIQAREYEQLIQDGITAIKNGDRLRAKRLLDQAAMINEADARIWIWLSATTDDLNERRDYLEHAVVVEPSNATARRGLLLINEKLDRDRLMPEGAQYVPQEAETPEESRSRVFLCPNCGATISYDIHDTELVCQHCGFRRKVDERVANESTEQPLDAALPTTRAHRWAASQSRLTCEQCGAVLLLPPGQVADVCPYCSSNRFITSPGLIELVDPGAIGVFKIDVQHAEQSIKSWLGKGMFAPDDLAARHAGMRLHPAYYPFWIFDGTVEIPWFCDVHLGTGKSSTWEAHTGSHFENFHDVLIPGIRKLSPSELKTLEPFQLNELVEFAPEILAGWSALTYDIPLADASLMARDQVVRSVKSWLPARVEVNRPKRNFSIGAGKWSGLTYKLALLPIYIGNYPFQGKRYRLMVNGQTGKVGGTKPLDTLKAAMLVITAVIVLIIVIAFFWILKNFLSG